VLIAGERVWIGSVERKMNANTAMGKNRRTIILRREAGDTPHAFFAKRMGTPVAIAQKKSAKAISEIRILAIALSAVTLASCSTAWDGYYIYYGDNEIFGGPFHSKEVCEKRIRDNPTIVPQDAICDFEAFAPGETHP
jgi:hypothetical protein